MERILLFLLINWFVLCLADDKLRGVSRRVRRAHRVFRRIGMACCYPINCPNYSVLHNCHLVFPSDPFRDPFGPFVARCCFALNPF